MFLTAIKLHLHTLRIRHVERIQHRNVANACQGVKESPCALAIDCAKTELKQKFHKMQ